MGRECRKLRDFASNVDYLREQAEDLKKDEGLFCLRDGEISSDKFKDNQSNIDIKADWQRIYEKWFNLRKDFLDLQFPELYDLDKNFAVIVAQELALDKVVFAMKEGFEVSLCEEGLDFFVTHSDRDAKNGDYAIFFGKNVEAYEEFGSLSVNMARALGSKEITLMERFLLELLYFEKSKEHLDVADQTLCGGSRSFFGFFLAVGWDFVNDKLIVDFCTTNCQDNKSGHRGASLK